MNAPVQLDKAVWVGLCVARRVLESTLAVAGVGFEGGRYGGKECVCLQCGACHHRPCRFY
jgi:hypothetical protein